MIKLLRMRILKWYSHLFVLMTSWKAFLKGQVTIRHSIQKITLSTHHNKQWSHHCRNQTKFSHNSSKWCHQEQITIRINLILKADLRIITIKTKRNKSPYSDNHMMVPEGQIFSNSITIDNEQPLDNRDSMNKPKQH